MFLRNSSRTIRICTHIHRGLLYLRHGLSCGAHGFFHLAYGSPAFFMVSRKLTWSTFVIDASIADVVLCGTAYLTLMFSKTLSSTLLLEYIVCSWLRCIGYGFLYFLHVFLYIRQRFLHVPCGSPLPSSLRLLFFCLGVLCLSYGLLVLALFPI